MKIEGLIFLMFFGVGKTHTKKLKKTAGRAKRRTARQNAEGAGEGLGGVKNRKIEAKDKDKNKKRGISRTTRSWQT